MGQKRTCIYPAKRPTKPEVVIDDSLLRGWHRVLYKATQVERSLPCFGMLVKVGLRCALMQPMGEFFLAEAPAPKFYVGEVVKIYGNPDDPIMEFKFDGGPSGCAGIHMGVRQAISFMIPLNSREDAFAKATKSKPRKPKATRNGKNTSR